MSKLSHLMLVFARPGCEKGAGKLKEISEDIAMLETSLYGRLQGFRKAFSMKTILLPAIRKLRKAISGTPFAKS